VTVLPSPIPHPLDFCPFDVPPWAYEALEWVVGFDWPDGNERTTWEVADHWYAITGALTGPAYEADTAATTVTSGYTGPGGEAFADAWQKVAAGDESPLAALLQLTDELGSLVEQCGSDLEGAKLEAWIELGIFLTELIAMAVTVALTVGAASPAAGGLIAATRMAIQQIFKRLVEDLGRKTIKQTLKDAGKRAVKQLTTREGLRHLGKEALHEGFEELGEETATNGGIQLYQGTGDRSHGFSWSNLGLSAVGGFAGGFTAAGAHAGATRHHSVTRGIAAETLGELGGSAAMGNLPSLENVAKAASSGGVSSSFESGKSGVTASLTSRLSALDPSVSGVLDSGSLPPAGSLSAAETPLPPDSFSSSSAPSFPDSSPAASPSSAPSPLIPSPSDVSPSTPSPSAPSPAVASSAVSSSSFDLSSLASSSGVGLEGGSGSGVDSPGGLDPAAVSSPAAQMPSLDVSGPEPSAGAHPSSGPPAGSPLGTPASTGGHVASSAVGHGELATTFAGPTSFETTPTPLTVDPSPAALSATPPASPSAHVTLPSSPTSSFFAPGTPPSELSTGTFVPTSEPPRPGRHAARHAGMTEHSSASEVDGYFENVRAQRSAYAAFRQRDAIDRLREKAQVARRQAQAARRSARIAKFLRLDRHTAAFFDENVTAATIVADRAEAEIRILQDPTYATDSGATTTVDPQDWRLANRDKGRLAPGSITLGTASMLTGNDNPPTVASTRQYGIAGGLRQPLAQHQLDVENAVPRDAYGNPQRLADPRSAYFSLLNDGGPAADPTRAINCQDCVLSFYDTYVHGRPRVSAPRTFDAFRDGDPHRPLNGEKIGPERIEYATGGTLQSLCKVTEEPDPAIAQREVLQALGHVSGQLTAGGHGSFAFLLNTWESGAAHAWAAVNHHGEILFVDPQSGLISPPGTSPYGHAGRPDPNNLTALDALVVDGQGNPLPFPNHKQGWWRPRETHLPPRGPRPSPIYRSASHHPPVPPAGEPHHSHSHDEEKRILEQLSPPERIELRDAFHKAAAVAESELANMRRVAADIVVGSDDKPPVTVDEKHRVKSLTSLARKFVASKRLRGLTLHEFLTRSTDRARFSIVLPESSYAPSLRQAIINLRRDGYEILEVQSFWEGGRGRHNGLNVTVANPDGFKFEIQFPTALSHQVGKFTHDLYEIIRLPGDSVDGISRFEAFLGILAINKAFDMPAHQPAQVNDLPGVDTVSTSLTRWLSKAGKQPALAYVKHLGSAGVTVDQALSAWGLTTDDIPGVERLISLYDRHALPLLRGSQGARLDRDHEPDSRRLAERRPQSSLVGRHRARMELRPLPDSDTAVRRFIRERVAAGREAGSRATSQGPAAQPPPDPGTAPGNDRRGREERLGLRPTAPPSVSPLNPQDLERQALASLTPAQLARLESAHLEAEAVATTELAAMRTLAALLPSTPDAHPRLVDEHHRVKTVPSLARKFVSRAFLKGVSLEQFLEASTDRVRFSIELPEQIYTAAVRDVLVTLNDSGYEVLEVQSFWGDGKGRHNGLNVTVKNPDGFPVEIQFPTDRSRRAGKKTHDLYEIVRAEGDNNTSLDIERAEAFLGILAVNKSYRMADHQPVGLSELPGVVSTDTSLARWASSRGGSLSWQAYLRQLSTEGTSLPEALAFWGLRNEDIPGIERLIVPHDRDDVRLLRSSEGTGRDRGDEPDGNPGSSPRGPSGCGLARGEKGMALRPGGSSLSALRRFIRERVAAGRPSDGGAVGSGAVAHRASSGRGPRRDDRGGQGDELAVRPAASGVADQESDPRELERRLLASLPRDVRDIIEGSVREAQVVADRVLPLIERLLRATGLDSRMTLVGVDQRVKSAGSVARTYLDEVPFESEGINGILSGMKDRVRFSIAVRDASYGADVRAMLSALADAGFAIGKRLMFWGGGGRHNGLNVTVREPSGATVEVQFPTPLSWAVGRETHSLYERMRLPRYSMAVRVEAFLGILAVNKSSGIDARQPQGLDLIGAVCADSTFGRWIAKNKLLWEHYSRNLPEEGGFDEVLARHGLTRADVFPPDVSGESHG
jgi:hypothetical protein